MIVDRSESNRTAMLVMVECPVCGAKRHRDYWHFSNHLASEHVPADFGLTGPGDT